MTTTHPMNGMQRMFVRWEEFHAVNAAHVVHLAPGLEAASVERACRDVTASLGLPPIDFDRRRVSIRYLDGPDAPPGPPFEHRPTGEPIARAVEAVMRDELNRPFAAGPHWPIRFTLIEHPEAGLVLSLLYEHALSDSRGMSVLLREIVRALHGEAPVIRRLDLSPPTIAQLFPRELGWRGAAGRAMDTAHEIAASRWCLHPSAAWPAEFTIVPMVHDLPLETAALKAAAKRLDITVQDLVLAGLLEALAAHFADRLAKSRRKWLAVYTPADLRREAGVPLDGALGSFLGSITARERVTPGMPFDDLARRVAAQTRRIKATKGYRYHDASMVVMSRIWDRFTRSLNRVAGPYLVPMAGFISNVNLSDFLADEIAKGYVRNYQRFTGTGIIAPMMLGITTVGPRVDLTTTHHDHVFTPDQIAAITTQVHRRLAGVTPVGADRRRDGA